MQTYTQQQPGIVQYLSDEPVETVKRAGARQVPFTQQFIDFYNNQQPYELQRTQVNDLIFGEIDVLRLKESFQRQLSFQQGHKFPSQVAIKTVEFSTDQERQNFIHKIEEHNREFFALDVQFVKVLGYIQLQNNQLQIFYEYHTRTLQQDIQERKELNNPYYEKLLWKILYNLVKASALAHEINYHIRDIIPSKIFYDNFQIKLIPYGLIPDIHTQQQSYFSPKEESQQIGKTILQAGLLLSDHEFRSASQDQLLRDFGRIYSGTEPERILHYTVQQLLLNQDINRRLTPTEIFEIFRPVEHCIYYLDVYSAKKQLIPQFESRFQDFRSFYHQNINEHHATQKKIFSPSKKIAALTSKIIKQFSPYASQYRY